MQITTDSSASSQPARAGWGWGLALMVVLILWGLAIGFRGGGGGDVLAGWQDGLEPGQALAAELDRPMVLLFTADWCGPCQELKRDVLTQPAVADALGRGFVPVFVDMTTAKAGDDRLMKYRVQGYPTVIVMSAEGRELQRIEGISNKPASSPQAFIDWLEQARESGPS